MPKSRQLAAIMFTDIVGYTALMGNDEQHAFALLNKNRQLQKPIIGEFDGRWIKEIGDGIMASFNTVSDAVNAAIKIQEAFNTTNDFQLRIGIHLGEVVFENDDVFGDGVNIAARIQAAASPGCIFISEAVNNNITNKKEIKTHFVKEEILKNISQPVRMYQVLFAGSEMIKAGTPVALIAKNSIAVLPFDNMSSDPDQEYFSDGLTEEIIADLSKLSSLHVISRTSAMAFKGSKKGVRTIGQELNVRYVLEGSVRKAGNKLRITAQLIDASNDGHLWAQKFDGVLDDVFDIQEKVSHAIVDSLRLELTQQERERLVVKSPVDPAAHEQYLEARYHLWQTSPSEVAKAIELFEAAIRMEPEYALAYAGLSTAYNYLGWFGAVEVYPKAKQAAIRALEIDETLAEPHAVLGYTATFYDWDWASAERELERALALNPNYAQGYLHYSWYLGSQDRLEEAHSAILRANELDPLSLIIRANMSNYYQWKRDYDGALAQTRRALMLVPNAPLALLFTGMAYWGKGEYDNAAIRFEKMLELTGGSSGFKGYLGYSYARAGRKESALAILSDLTVLSKSEPVPSFQFALVLIGLGQFEESLTWLEKAFDERGSWFPYIRQECVFDPLRNYPRFQDLVRRMYFPNHQT